MKNFFLTFLLFLFCFSGCRFLRGGDDLAPDEDSYAEESMGGEESEDMWEEEDEDMSELEEDDWGEDEDWSDEEEWSEEEGETGEKKGFLSRLFGGNKAKNQDSEMEEEGQDSEDLVQDYDDYEIVDNSGQPDESVEAPLESSTEETAVFEPETESVPTEEGTEAEPIVTAPETVTEASPRKSLNKIISSPYQKSGVLVNAVYIARSGETLNSISQILYFQDKTSELLKVNPHLSNRAVVVGDKIYYNSPNRPTDNSQLLFYYEDNNRSPSYYNVSPGDNIREISYQLLGHAKSWKEIWATNRKLQSKGTVNESISIVYWPEQAVATSPPSPEPSAEPAPTEQPAPADLAEQNLPTAEEGLMAEDSMGDNNSPEFPLAENPELPTVPPIEDNTEKQGFLGKMINKALKDIEVLIGFLLIIGILVFLVLTILKKRKQKDFDYTSTNISA